MERDGTRPDRSKSQGDVEDNQGNKKRIPVSDLRILTASQIRSPRSPRDNSLRRTKSKSSLRDGLHRAVFKLQSKFDYFAPESELCKNMLKYCLQLTGSEYGYFAEVKIWDKVPVMLVHDLVIDRRQPKSLTPEERKSIISVITSPGTAFAIVVENKEVVIANEPSVEKRPGYEIPDPHPPLSNFAGIPLFKSTVSEDKTLFSVIGLGNRQEGFSQEYIQGIYPYIKTCEVLFEAHKNHKTAYNQQKREDIHILVAMMKTPDSGLPLKDRKHHLKTYRACFTGKEAVNWMLLNAQTFGVKTREDAVLQGNKLINMNIFQHVTREHQFEDENYFYQFIEDTEPVSPLARPSSPSSPFSESSSPQSLARSRSKSFEGQFLESKYRLHSLICSPAKPMAHGLLKKKLTKKKVIEHLNDQNERGQTALHLAIEGGDLESFEVLLQAYTTHLGKVDIHVKDHQGYTPLHSAAETGNERFLLSLLQYPGIQVNILNEHFNTPFHSFCSKYSSPSSIKTIFDLFLSRGANINAQNRSGESPLHKAVINPVVRALLVRILVEHGADPNISNHHGETPLHYAIHLKRKDIVYTLLTGGADPTLKKNEDTKTPYRIACEEPDNEEVLSLLNKRQDLKDWLEQIEMEKYLTNFIKELIFKDVLYFITDATLSDMGVSLTGDRLRIMQAIESMKKEEEKKKKGPIMAIQEVEVASTPTRGGAKMRLGELRPKKAAFAHKMSIPTPTVTPTNLRRSESRELENILTSNEMNVIEYKDLEFTELLGTGTSGDVYRGVYRGDELALKVLHKDRSSKMSEFASEFKIMSAIRSPYVVSFYGACMRPKMILVLEYCSGGSLFDQLSEPKLMFGWKEFLRFSQEMVRGVHALHSNEPQILHRDLKSMNFLITRQWNLKVCDFGLSRFFTNSNMTTFFQMRGTMCYCAPEIYDGKRYTVKSDIYSLGIIMWEMLYRIITGEYQRPFSEFAFITQAIQIIIQASTQELRPTIPNRERCPASVVDLIESCWSNNPSSRPSTQEMLDILDKCKMDFAEHQEDWNGAIMAKQ